MLLIDIPGLVNFYGEKKEGLQKIVKGNGLRDKKTIKPDKHIRA